jgi:predicted nucleic acid-binding protein
LKLLVDNSVIFKLFIEEDKSDIARDIYAQEHEFYYLDFTILEAANSFASAVRRKRINQQEALENFTTLKIMAQNIIISANYLSQAFELALSINHSVYDCLYAIAAKENDAVLVTAGDKFAQKLNPDTFKILII